MEPSRYLAGYPQEVIAKVHALIEQDRLGAVLQEKYGDACPVRNTAAMSHSHGEGPEHTTSRYFHDRVVKIDADPSKNFGGLKLAGKQIFPREGLPRIPMHERVVATS